MIIIKSCNEIIIKCTRKQTSEHPDYEYTKEYCRSKTSKHSDCYVKMKELPFNTT
jgi:hypothetical protein